MATMPGGATDPTVGSESERLKFLQGQLTYFMSHLSLADAKVAGITVFSVTISGVTADRIDWTGVANPTWINAIGFVALAGSLAAVFFSFRAIWPRLDPGQLTYDVFSWAGVAASKRLNKVPHHTRTLAASHREMCQGIAAVSESLAVIIERKYGYVQKALMALAPATAIHIVFWVLA